MIQHVAGAARFGSILLAALALSSMATPSRADMSVYGLYDLRHATDPADNPGDFPVIELKGLFHLGFGSFLFKEEIDLDGAKDNPSQVYTELDQSIKLGHATLWGAPLLLHLGYSGGLGLFDGTSGGYYVQNAYSIGPEYSFRLAGAYCDVYAALRYTDAVQRSYDPTMAFWIGKYFLGYKVLVANSLEAWTEPYAPVDGSGGRRIASWELESEAWYQIARDLSVGTYVRTTRNVYTLSGRWVIYPSIGVRYAF